MERCKDSATGLTAGPNQSAVCQCLELVRRHGLCPCVRFRGRVRLQWDALRLGAAIDCFPCLRVSSTYLREPFTHAGLSLACTCIAHAAWAYRRRRNACVARRELFSLALDLDFVLARSLSFSLARSLSFSLARSLLLSLSLSHTHTNLLGAIILILMSSDSD